MNEIFKEHHTINQEKKLGNPYIKLLYTANTNQEIAQVLSNMDYSGIVYISTAYLGKCKLLVKDRQITVLKTNLTANEFRNDLENESSDCLVFHIEQLIAGINITGLTGCILQYIETNIDYISTKQTIGRTLRKTGEKTGGIVTFLIKDEDLTEASLARDLDNIRDLMFRMYGEHWCCAKVKDKIGVKPLCQPNSSLPYIEAESVISDIITYPSWYLTLKEHIKLRVKSMDKAKEKGNAKLLESIKESITTLIIDTVNDKSFSLLGHDLEDRQIIERKLIIDIGDWNKI